MHMTKIDGQKARDDASRLIGNLGPGGNTNLGDGIIKGLDVSEASIESMLYENRTKMSNILTLGA